MIPKSETLRKTANCEVHGPYEAEGVNTSFGARWWTTCPQCTEEREARVRVLEVEDARKRLLEKKRASNIPPRYLEASFRNYSVTCTSQEKALKTAKAYAANFVSVLETGAGLLLCGKPGTGKTHLSLAIANHLIQNFSVLYAVVPEAIGEIRDSWRHDSNLSQTDVIKRFISPKLLILDEVGLQRQTDDERILLYQILDGRYRRRLPTVAISNLDRKGVEQSLGERVVERLLEGDGTCVIFGWESYRKKAYSQASMASLGGKAQGSKPAETIRFAQSAPSQEADNGR